MTRTIETVEQVEAIRNEIEEHAEAEVTGYSRPDWEEWLDRLEMECDLDIGSDMTSPAIKRILAIGRQVRRETV